MPGLPMQQEAIALMQKTSSTDGSSLYDHLTDVVMKVMCTRCRSFQQLLPQLKTQVLTPTYKNFFCFLADSQRAADGPSQPAPNLDDGEEDI